MFFTFIYNEDNNENVANSDLNQPHFQTGRRETSNKVYEYVLNYDSVRYVWKWAIRIERFPDFGSKTLGTIRYTYEGESYSYPEAMANITKHMP